jgi:uncharacterized integral membrane protein (TIGR00698 family)
MTPQHLIIALTAVALVALSAPSWAALTAGATIAIAFDRPLPPALKPWSGRALQTGVVLLGAGIPVGTVIKVGASGAAMTAVSLTIALGIGALLGRLLRVPRDTTLLLTVGTAICGGSAIAAVASVIKPKEYELTAALCVVFLLNGVALFLLPPLGRALALDDATFGRFAALAVHDTSSVIGAALAYSPASLAIATTTKLARALWIVPVTFAAFALRRGELRGVKWPSFIVGFVLVALIFSWAPLPDWAQTQTLGAARRLFVLALFLVGLSLSRATLRQVGARPLALGVLLWLAVGLASLPLALFP